MIYSLEQVIPVARKVRYYDYTDGYEDRVAVTYDFVTDGEYDPTSAPVAVDDESKGALYFTLKSTLPEGSNVQIYIGGIPTDATDVPLVLHDEDHEEPWLYYSAVRAGTYKATVVFVKTGWEQSPILVDEWEETWE